MILWRKAISINAPKNNIMKNIPIINDEGELRRHAKLSREFTLRSCIFNLV